MNEQDILEKLDLPAVNSGIFYPRPDPGYPPPEGSIDLSVKVSDADRVAVRFHPTDPQLPTILHFHGNGEIVHDYDPIAPVLHALGASVAFAEFRGYGLSTGRPTVRALLRDAHPVLDAVLEALRERGHTGPLVVMGRSLGSAPAIELASSRPDDMTGLIIESGFARMLPLLGLLGVTASFLGLDAIEGIDNENKMEHVRMPVLLLHAEGDMLVPRWHAERNFEHAASRHKRLVMIPEADHNSIMAVGGQLYWGSIAVFIDGLRSSPVTSTGNP